MQSVAITFVISGVIRLTFSVFGYLCGEVSSFLLTMRHLITLTCVATNYEIASILQQSDASRY